jgi:hypothetical protein
VFGVGVGWQKPINEGLGEPLLYRWVLQPRAPTQSLAGVGAGEVRCYGRMPAPKDVSDFLLDFIPALLTWPCGRARPSWRANPLPCLRVSPAFETQHERICDHPHARHGAGR